MIKSYSDLYVEEACTNLGAMMEHAVVIGFDTDAFWNLFKASELARQIEKGNPRYIAGCSGRDYIDIVINKNDEHEIINDDERVLSYDEYYWAGYALGGLQQKTGLSFFDIDKILPFKNVLQMYKPLHEADLSKFYDLAIKKISSYSEKTNLRKIRVACGLSQSQLAKASDVDLRSIQMYEQRKNDINKSQSTTLYKLSKALHCNLEALLQKERMQ